MFVMSREFPYSGVTEVPKNLFLYSPPSSVLEKKTDE